MKAPINLLNPRPGLSQRTAYVPQKTVLIGGINEGAVPSKTKSPQHVRASFSLRALSWARAARAAFAPLPKPKVLMVTPPLLLRKVFSKTTT